jgi:hypothetical protein
LIEYDYSKLCGRIKEVFGTQEAFAKEIQMSATTLISKLSNKVKFRQDEIERSMKALKLNRKLIPLYFFKRKVEKSQQK